MLSPEIVEGRTAVRAGVDDALSVGAIDDFPGFPDGLAGREIFSELALESASAPNAFHGDGFEGDGLGVFHDGGSGG
jgi:hypothetical protein